MNARTEPSAIGRPASVRRTLPALPGLLLLLALILLAVLRSHAGTRLDSFTIDEPWHVVAGTTYARTGDYTSTRSTRRWSSCGWAPPRRRISGCGPRPR